VDTQPGVTEHAIPRHWCPTCQKLVEPPVADALPGTRFGHRLVALTAWLHYGLGLTLSQILAVLGHHLHFRLSEGGLVDAWQHVAAILQPWYEKIADEVKQGGTLHADETGWRVAGRTVWLWCFTTAKATYYMVAPSRGSPALSKFFTEALDGILIVHQRQHLHETARRGYHEHTPVREWEPRFGAASVIGSYHHATPNRIILQS
jgi:hypothetical protein